MEDFEKLEKEFARTVVNLVEPGFTGSGVLNLDHEKTTAVLSTDKSFLAKRGESGWFDVRLRTPRGQHILLHNALNLDTAMPHEEGGQYETRLFPNTVVINSDGLTKDGRVGSVAFRAEGLGSFFYYEQVESHSLGKTDKKSRAALKDVRKTTLSKRYPRKFDFFLPSQILIVHSLPRFFRFRVRERTYEAWRTQGLSVSYASEHRLRSEPVLRISFDKPVPIDEALSAVWEWRRFFSQVAMAPLALQALGARSPGGRRRPTASFYLPNLRRREAARSGPFDFNAGDSPYFRWRDRAKLGALMKEWLSKEPTRRVFRVTLDRVIEAIQTRHSLDDVVSLCSAIESLDELAGQPTLEKKDVKTIAAGAIAAAKAAKIEVEDNRIRGVLGMLRSQSLPARMRLLAKALDSLLPADVMKGVSASAHSLRQVAAHGLALEDPVVPTVGPTVEALAGMCALYDLVTCGAPAKGDGHQLTALLRAFQYGQYLRQFKPRAESS